MDYCKYLLCGLLIVACLSAAYGKPNPNENENKKDESVMDPEDYSYVEESDPSGESSTVVPNIKPTSVPIITEKEAKQYANIGDQNVTLQCSVKNLSENNVILWYKSENVVSTGHVVNNELYKLSGNNLIISTLTKDLLGDYFCHVTPHNIRSHIALMLNNIDPDIKEAPKEVQHPTEPEEPKLEQPQAKTDEKPPSSDGNQKYLISSAMMAVCYFISIAQLRI